MTRKTKNWKTTLAGWLTGVALTVALAAKDRQVNPSAPPVTFTNLAPGIAVGILSTLTKDRDVTGGTRQQ